jgi:predicted hydrocarbon binding protein
MNQVLDSLNYDPETGSLGFQSARYLLVPPSLFVELQKSLEGDLGRGTQAHFVDAAAPEGAALANRFHSVFGYPPDQVLKSVAYMLSESGWGIVTSEMVNLEGRELVFKVLESPFAEAYGPSTQSVCYTVLGILQGVGMTVLDCETSGMEVQCAAKGDSCCRFVVSAK